MKDAYGDVLSRTRLYITSQSCRTHNLWRSTSRQHLAFSGFVKLRHTSTSEEVCPEMEWIAMLCYSLYSLLFTTTLLLLTEISPLTYRCSNFLLNLLWPCITSGNELLWPFVNKSKHWCKYNQKANDGGLSVGKNIKANYCYSSCSFSCDGKEYVGPIICMLVPEKLAKSSTM